MKNLIFYFLLLGLIINTCSYSTIKYKNFFSSFSTLKSHPSKKESKLSSVLGLLGFEDDLELKNEAINSIYRTNTPEKFLIMSKDKKSAQHSLISRDSRGSGLLSGLVILPSLQDLLGQVEPSSANKSLFLLDISLRDSQNSESLTSENLLQHLSSIKFEGLHSLVLSFRCEAGTDKNKLQILIVKLAKFFHKKKFSNFFFFLHGRIISNRNIESFQQKLINFNEIMTKPTNFTKEESLSQTIANSSLYFSSSPAYKLSIFNDKLEPIEDPDSYVNSIETQTNLDRKRIVEGGNELAMGDVYLEDLITFMSSIDHANVQERTQQLKTKNLSDFLVFSLAYDGIFSNEYLKVLRANGISKEKEVLDALFFNYTKLKQKLAQPVSLHSKDSLQDSPGDLTLPASVRQLLEEKENEKNYMDEFSKIFDHDESNRLMRLYEETVDQSFNQQLFFEKFCSLLHEKYPSLKHSEAMRLSNLFVNHVLSAKQRIIFRDYTKKLSSSPELDLKKKQLGKLMDRYKTNI